MSEPSFDLTSARFVPGDDGWPLDLLPEPGEDPNGPFSLHCRATSPTSWCALLTPPSRAWLLKRPAACATQPAPLDSPLVAAGALHLELRAETAT